MAVTTLISAAGILPPRPVEALILIQRVQSPTDEAQSGAPRPGTVRDLSEGLGTRERQRIHLMANAERLRDLATQVERDRELTDQISALDRLCGNLDRIGQAVARAGAEDVAEDERADLEQQANELAGNVGVEITIRGEAAGPEVADLTGLGFQPDTLGAIESVRASAGAETRGVEELRTRVEAATERVAAEQERAAQARTDALRPAGPEQSGGVEVEAERVEERLGLLTSEEARGVADQLQQETRDAQGAPLIHQLTALLPDNVLAVVP